MIIRDDVGLLGTHRDAAAQRIGSSRRSDSEHVDISATVLCGRDAKGGFDGAFTHLISDDIAGAVGQARLQVHVAVAVGVWDFFQQHGNAHVYSFARRRA